MNFEGKYIDELLERRYLARENKDWKLSDEIRNYLDSKFVFVFDTKEGQEIYHMPESHFDKVYNYPEKRIEEEDGSVTIIPAWSETKLQKLERLHNIKFTTKRQFVEWEIKQDIKVEKFFEAWLYSTLESMKRNNGTEKSNTKC